MNGLLLNVGPAAPLGVVVVNRENEPLLNSHAGLWKNARIRVGTPRMNGVPGLYRYVFILFSELIGVGRTRPPSPDHRHSKNVERVAQQWISRLPIDLNAQRAKVCLNALASVPSIVGLKLAMLA